MATSGKILISATGTVITPYRKYQCKQLESSTSVRNPIYKKWDEVTGFALQDEEGSYFATKMNDEEYLAQILPRYEIAYIPRRKGERLSKSFGLSDDITPTDVQYDIIKKITDLESSKQWFVYLSQGLGKTLLSVYMASYFNVKTIIMCYSSDILFQWKDTIAEKTTMDTGKILMIDSGTLLDKIYSGKFDVSEYDVFMCTPKLLTGYGKRKGWKILTSLFDIMGIGFKIFDEAHRNISNIIKINAFTSIDKTLYLSGDFGQSSSWKQNLYYSIFYKIPIIKPDTELMNTLKFTTAIVINYNSEPTTIEQGSVYTRSGVFSYYEFMKYQFRKEYIFEVIDYVMKKIADVNTSNWRILILLNLTDQVDQLQGMYSAKYPDKTVGRFHSGVNDEEKRYSKNEADIIISTYMSFGTGIDVKNIKYIISCSACTKIDDNQASGRARPLSDGSNAHYFMLNDVGFKYNKDKIKPRINYLIETKIKEIIQLDYV